MHVKPHHPLAELLATLLHGIEGVPLAEQRRMKMRACREVVKWHKSEVEEMEKEIKLLQESLHALDSQEE